MFLTATILYFGESPVGYDVYRDEGEFRFLPAADSRSLADPPLILVKEINSAWEISGVEDVDLKEQVQSLIRIHNLVDLGNELSAAS